MTVLKSLPVEAVGEAQEIPDKLYFRIGEVSRLAGLKQYVLRYWETEFPALQPKKSGTNHRLYRRKDVELILEIKRLLYDKRFTIEGARNFLAHRQSEEERLKPASKPKQPRVAVAEAGAAKVPQQTALFQLPTEILAGIRRELQEILELLK